MEEANKYDRGYYIEGEFDVVGSFLKCPKCGKKILVEVALCGTNHNVGITVICAECVIIVEEFRLSHPEQTAAIEKWAKS